MMHFFQRLYFFYFYAMLALGFLIIFPLFVWYLRKPETHYKANAVRSFACKILLKCTFINVEIIKKNNAHLLKNETCIYICNHSSYLDIFALQAVITGYYGFLGKAELVKTPLFSASFKYGLDIEVARDSKEQSAVSLKKSITALRNGKSLIIFPEAGIFPDPYFINEFKDGAFMLAIRNKVPIVPILMPDNHKRLPDEEKRGTPGKIRVILHDAVETNSYGNDEFPKLKDELHDFLQTEILNYK